MLSFEELNKKAVSIWKDTLKIHKQSPSVRVASSLSPLEMMIGLYYGGYIRFNPDEPLKEDRDRVIFSKGHGSICMYPILADLGFFSKELLSGVGKKGSFLGSIPDPVIPGYETVNGSLGHGVGVGCGMALGCRLKSLSSKVVVLVGDGELCEGANWEAAMFSSRHQLDNLTVIVDYNKICMLDRVENIVSLEPLGEKFKAFGWSVHELEDGNDLSQIMEVFNKSFSESNGKPKVIIGHTVKGHGVPSLENKRLSHVMSVSPEEIDGLLEEVGNE
jgi:transketolase